MSPGRRCGCSWRRTHCGAQPNSELLPLMRGPQAFPTTPLLTCFPSLCVRSVCLHVCTTCVPCLQRPEGVVSSPGAGVIDNHETPCQYREPTPRPLQEQPVLLTMETTLQPCCFVLFRHGLMSSGLASCSWQSSCLSLGNAHSSLP